MFRRPLMALRLLISDALWSKIEPVLRELKHAAGSPPKLSDRMFIEAVLYQARTGIPWRDLPDEFGDWNAVYHRFRGSGSGSRASTMGGSRSCSSTRRLCARISTRPGRQKTVDSRLRLWVALRNGRRIDHQAARGLTDERTGVSFALEWGRASRRDGIRGGVGGGGGQGKITRNVSISVS